ncbi:helix-turn-helix domain-containing protein [Mycolicibacterium fortuitum]|uniref:helix-turn-helix domain-containing protein n=1 Tax=Mycolicibacterium fortuitum TaxID=1766 RepID=UPI0033A933B5
MAAGISISELERRAATSRSRIHEYENDSGSPTVAVANRILRGINLTLALRPLEETHE